MTIQELQNLPPYTDNFSASRPSKKALEKARLLEKLLGCSSMLATASDGTIQMKWVHRDGQFSICIGSRGGLGVLLG